ncbi:MAG TPA: hypothetical protein VFD35_01155 [Pricia sp.]|nr:hypothetical protein [Pricia sp.]
MEQQKRGRKQLGNGKRNHIVMLRFDDTEYSVGRYLVFLLPRSTRAFCGTICNIVIDP